MLRTRQLCDIFGEPVHWLKNIEALGCLPFVTAQGETRQWRVFTADHILALALLRQAHHRFALPLSVAARAIRGSGVVAAFLRRVDASEPVNGVALAVQHEPSGGGMTYAVCDLADPIPDHLDGATLIRVLPVYRTAWQLATSAGASFEPVQKEIRTCA